MDICYSFVSSYNDASNFDSLIVMYGALLHA